MSFRLNKTDKEKLLKALLEAKFGPIKEKIQDDLNTLADEAYKKLVEPYRAHLEALPDEWTRKASAIELRPLSTAYGRTSVDLNEKSLFRNSSSHRAIIDLDKELTSKLEKILHRRVDTGEKHRSLKAEVEATLAQLTTSTRAIEVWPELEPFLKKLGKDTAANLPAIQRTDLNKRLGLETIKE